VTRSNAVKLAQTITFNPLPTPRKGTDPPVGAHAHSSSNLTVTFTSLTPDVCTIGGPAGATITTVAAGLCTIEADQSGNATYNPAPAVTRSFTITAVDQTLNFPQPPNRTLAQSPATLGATAGSGLPVTLTSKTGAVCTVTGNSVTLIGAGTCTIQATQPGNGIYNPAAPVTRSFSVTKANQTISFPPPRPSPPGPRKTPSPFTVTATASSGLAVTFTSATPSVCSSTGVGGATVTVLATGTCTIDADQPGNATYNAAPTVAVSIHVST
jgi:hypothetical protein